MDSPQSRLFVNWGNPGIRVAVLDGRADLAHPCFEGGHITLLSRATDGEQADPSDAMAAHGTHVASVLFGQHASDVAGLVPNCTGFVIPIFSSEARSVTQLDLARAIELAVEHGAHVINISGGQLTDAGEADVWLHNAMRLCCDRNVLVIAAAGNDGCACLHVPAALPHVLAVGALDRQDQPMDFSNWGDAYRTSGVTAPGEDILGARPGGGTSRASGTSFATPLVAGAAALLLSEQHRQGQTPDPLGIRQLLLDTALPCEGSASDQPGRCLAGKLNLPGAFDALTGSKDMNHPATTTETAISPQCACGGDDQLQQDSLAGDAEPQATEPEHLSYPLSPVVQKSAALPAAGASFSAPTARSGHGRAPLAASYAQGARLSAITPSQSPDEVAAAPGLVFSIGVLGYDFGSEARRDSFKQAMLPVDRTTGLPVEGPNADPLLTYPPNPYDARQMVEHLRTRPSDARLLIWTLNIDLTPVYVIEPAGPYAAEVYETLRGLLGDEIRTQADKDYIERVSIPGLLSGRTVKLFSGQVVPVIEPQNTRGIYGWRTTALVNFALEHIIYPTNATEDERQKLYRSVGDSFGDFLNRVYYDIRNLGKTSHDRALNFGVTNAFNSIAAFADPRVVGMQLDSITVDKGPFCRMDSDCWDVKLKFFDPENNQRAKRIVRYTVDVSDLVPVLVGEPRSWSAAD